MSELKSEVVYREIRRQILAGELKPGTRLVTRTMAADLGASDIPIREALWMLEREGLVEIVPYRGARVVVLSAEEVAEIYFIRGHLEALATQTAVPHIDKDAIETLGGTLRGWSKPLNRRSPSHTAN